MSDVPDAPSPVTPQDVADAVAFALRFQGRKRVHNTDELMSAIGGLFMTTKPDRSNARPGAWRRLAAARRLGAGSRADGQQNPCQRGGRLQQSKGRRRRGVSERSTFQSCHGRPGNLAAVLPDRRKRRSFQVKSIATTNIILSVQQVQPRIWLPKNLTLENINAPSPYNVASQYQIRVRVGHEAALRKIRP